MGASVGVGVGVGIGIGVDIGIGVGVGAVAGAVAGVDVGAVAGVDVGAVGGGWSNSGLGAAAISLVLISIALRSGSMTYDSLRVNLHLRIVSPCGSVTTEKLA